MDNPEGRGSTRVWDAGSDTDYRILLFLAKKYGRISGSEYKAGPVIEDIVREVGCTQEKAHSVIKDLVRKSYIEIRTSDNEMRDMGSEPESNDLFTFKESVVLLTMEICLGLLEQNSYLKIKLENLDQEVQSSGRKLEKIEDDLKKLDTVKKEVEAAKDDVNEKGKELAGQMEKFRKDMPEEVKETAQNVIQEALKRTGEIGSFMQEIQKDIFQYMGLFIAVFAILGLNIGGASGRTVQELLKMNLILIASLVTMSALLSSILKPRSRNSYILVVLAIILWGMNTASFYLLV